MELPARSKGDQLLAAGEHTDIRRRLRAIASRHDLSTVIVCAFDHRTRMLPFFHADLRMAPAGVRAVGASLLDSGFDKTRIVLQQWSRNFRPSLMRLDGRMPDLLLISSMSLHTAACKELIRDVCRIVPEQRPLVIAGGSLCIYEPWEVFYTDGNDRGNASGASVDVAVTGEEYVLLNLLEVLLAGRQGDEPLRQTFAAARDCGALDAVPGLVYPRWGGADDAAVTELVNTGPQRLLGDLDELPYPAAAYEILEPPSRSAQLASAALPASEVRRHSPIASLAMTFGCRFACDYCPIPAYNQRNLRGKSGQRIAEEMHALHARFGIRYYFGTDDSFLSNPRALEIVDALASFQRDGVRLARHIRWGTEATVHDTLRMREHLPIIRKSGMRALWLGVEDMSGALVRKGQGQDKTTEAFRLLRSNGICPMPMLIHHDAQPLVSRGSQAGLLNQINMLRKAGAVSVQVLMLTPSAGSKTYEQAYTSGFVFDSVAGRSVEPRMYDGNHVIATGVRRPWRKQLNLMVAYAYFYNPLRLVSDILRHRGPVGWRPAGMQILGMWGLTLTLRRTAGWAMRLLFGKATRRLAPPESPWPMRTPMISLGSRPQAVGDTARVILPLDK